MNSGEEVTDHHRGVILSGHVYNVRQWKGMLRREDRRSRADKAVCSWLLAAKTQDRKRILDINDITVRLQQLDRFLAEMGNLLADCPPELRLEIPAMADEDLAAM